RRKRSASLGRCAAAVLTGPARLVLPVAPPRRTTGWPIADLSTAAPARIRRPKFGAGIARSTILDGYGPAVSSTRFLPARAGGSYVPGKPSRNEKPVTVTPSGAPASPASALDRNRRRAHRRGRRGRRGRTRDRDGDSARRSP